MKMRGMDMFSLSEADRILDHIRHNVETIMFEATKVEIETDEFHLTVRRFNEATITVHLVLIK